MSLPLNVFATVFVLLTVSPGKRMFLTVSRKENKRAAKKSVCRPARCQSVMTKNMTASQKSVPSSVEKVLVTCWNSWTSFIEGQFRFFSHKWATIISHKSISHEWLNLSPKSQAMFASWQRGAFYINLSTENNHRLDICQDGYVFHLNKYL